MHFGIESYTPEELSETVAALRALNRPLVYTVHDLENPQLLSQEAHRASLAVLAEAADELITLTGTAADEVFAFARRHPTVIAHPTLLGDAERPSGVAHDATRIGVHLRDLRPNIDGVGTTATLVRAVADLRAQGARVEAVVRMNENVRDARLRHPSICSPATPRASPSSAGSASTTTPWPGGSPTSTRACCPTGTAPSRDGRSSATTSPYR